MIKNQTNLKSTLNTSKRYTAKDKFGHNVTIESQILDPQSSLFSDSLKSLSEILAQAYVPVELQFAKMHPEVLSTDMFLNSLVPLFKDGINNVDWPLAENRIGTILRQFFAEGFAKSMSANSAASAGFDHLLVVAKDLKTGVPVGAIYFLISKQDPHSNIRIPIFGVAPNAQHRGLGKLLMSSVLKHMPETKKISLSTRSTNENALKAYQAWGFAFTQSPKGMEAWASMECASEHLAKLQKSAGTFVG